MMHPIYTRRWGKNCLGLKWRAALKKINFPQTVIENSSALYYPNFERCSDWMKTLAVVWEISRTHHFVSTFRSISWCWTQLKRSWCWRTLHTSHPTNDREARSREFQCSQRGSPQFHSVRKIEIVVKMRKRMCVECSSTRNSCMAQAQNFWQEIRELFMNKTFQSEA